MSLLLQEAELLRAHLVLPELSCDCPARLHDKERPLELVSLPGLTSPH